MVIKGTLNFYFPCEVKTDEISSLRKKWNICRKRQQCYVKRNNLPSTELYDNLEFRKELDRILTQFWTNHFLFSEFHNAPFASSGIRKAYHGLREDTLFSKNISARLSTLQLKFQSVEGEDVHVRGNVLININIENGLGSIIVALYLPKIQPNELIFLKHVFYKRLFITINAEEQSIQGFICRLVNMEFKSLNIRNIDYRARYSFLELDGIHDLHNDINTYYGLLNADESILSIKKNNLKRDFGLNLFNRATRGYYLSQTNALVLHNLKNEYCEYNDFTNQYNREDSHKSICEFQTDESRNSFRDYCQRYISHLHIDVIDEKYSYLPDNEECPVAGTKNNLFAEFLRAVEVHYLLDKALTSEIVEQKRSAVNPLVFIPRAFFLWKILYEKTVNKYHINENLMSAFGINKNIESVKEEYASLQQLIINSTVILISALTLFMTIISIL